MRFTQIDIHIKLIEQVINAVSSINKNIKRKLAILKEEKETRFKTKLENKRKARIESNEIFVCRKFGSWSLTENWNSEMDGGC